MTCIGDDVLQLDRDGCHENSDPEHSEPSQLKKKRFKFVSMFIGNSHTSRRDVKLLRLIAVVSIKQ